ncbi:hypothetical protein [Devosia sp.]
MKVGVEDMLPASFADVPANRRVDDHRVLSGILFVIGNGFR